MLLSTHMLPEVEAVCDRVVVIAGGRIAAQGTPDELRNSRRLQARVLVECKGPLESVQNILSHLSGVSKVEMLPPDGDKTYVTAAVRTKDGYDVREEAARAVMQQGWALREIRLEHATLEEFFVQVTANQAVGKTGGAA